MKKIFAMMSSALMLTSMISCNVNKSNPPTEEDSFTYKTILVKQEDDSLKVKFNFIVDYPVNGNDSLVNEIKKNIFLTFEDSTTTDFSENHLQAIADKYVNDGRKDIKSMYEGADKPIYIMYEYTGSIKVMENTEKYVTYYINSYLFEGGAHGMPYKGYLTIDKITKKTLSLFDIIDKDKTDELKTVLARNIIEQYYRRNLYDNEKEMSDIELPKLAPAITTEGIMFIYGAYEIDCYAAGMPYCVIPFDEISDLMTDKAKALIK